ARLARNSSAEPWALAPNARMRRRRVSALSTDGSSSTTAIMGAAPAMRDSHGEPAGRRVGRWANADDDARSAHHHQVQHAEQQDVADDKTGDQTGHRMAGTAPSAELVLHLIHGERALCLIQASHALRAERRSVSEGLSPNRSRYSPAKRPSSWKPKRVAT